MAISSPLVVASPRRREGYIWLNWQVSWHYCRQQDQSSDSEDDVSSEPRLGGERGARRFFTKRQRKVSGDAGATVTTSAAERQHTDVAQQGALRRRMSKVITRRNRTVPTLSSGSSDKAIEGVLGGDDAPAAISIEDRDAVKNSEPPVVDVNGREEGGGGTTIAGMRDGNDGADDGAEEKEARQEEPPPFTMALVVMLTGLRLFVVDQVCCADRRPIRRSPSSCDGGRGVTTIRLGSRHLARRGCLYVNTCEVGAY